MRKFVLIALVAALAYSCQSRNPVGPGSVTITEQAATTTTTVPTTLRYVAFQAPPTVPNDMTLFLRQISSGTAASLLALVPFTGTQAADLTWEVTGVWGSASGMGGTVQGRLTGQSLDGARFTGSLLTNVGTCTAERSFTGTVSNQVLQWTGGQTLRDCPGSPLSFPSITMLKSDLPAPTTTPTTSILPTTTTIPRSTTTTTTSPQCTFSLSPTTVLVGAAGGLSSVDIRTNERCEWTAQAAAW